MAIWLPLRSHLLGVKVEGHVRGVILWPLSFLPLPLLPPAVHLHQLPLLLRLDGHLTAKVRLAGFPPAPAAVWEGRQRAMWDCRYRGSDQLRENHGSATAGRYSLTLKYNSDATQLMFTLMC